MMYFGLQYMYVFYYIYATCLASAKNDNAALGRRVNDEQHNIAKENYLCNILVPERACNEDAKECTKKLLAAVDYIQGSMFEDVEKLRNETVKIDKKSNDMDSQTNVYVILIMVALAFSILCIPALLLPAFLICGLHNVTEDKRRLLKALKRKVDNYHKQSTMQLTKGLKSQDAGVWKFSFGASSVSVKKK